MVLLDAMRISEVYTLVFSSSATVYGSPHYLPYDEDHPICPINPYGQTKLAVENILKDLASSSENWRIISLRYFNPVGAHESALIGEMPKGTPNNLMPCLLRVASKELPYLQVFGNDYPTKDGTAVRDYIHVIDLATGHIKALDYLKQHKGYDCFNLGTGQPYSVLEVVKTFEAINEIEIPLEIGPKRSGDLPEYFATSDKAKNLMLWQPELSLIQMCKTAWSWKKNLNQIL
jgi:UDP-glucose 4-epimerase